MKARLSIGFVAGLAVGSLVFVAGMAWQAIDDHAELVAIAGQLDRVAGFHCIYYREGPRHDR